MQNPQHRRVSKYLGCVGLVIAGVLFAVHSASPAESYVRFFKQGVVYYYLPDGKPAPPPPVATNLPPPPSFLPIPQTKTIIQRVDQTADLWSWLIRIVSRMEPSYTPKAIASQSTPLLTSIKPGKVNDLPGNNFFASMGLTPRYLGRLWAMIGFPVRQMLATLDNSGKGPRASQQTQLPIDEARALVREACDNFLCYAQEQYAAESQKQRGSFRFQELNPLGFCFPVAYPFSFRDSWGDARSGGRFHRAVDIFAREGTEVYAVTAGVIQTLATFPEAGITLILSGQDQKSYGYMHLQSYAEGIVEGKQVKSGELVGYVGRTGIQQSEAHLHFQVYADHRLNKDELLNPYDFLAQLCHGQGVTDLHQHKVAQIIKNPVYENPEMPVRQIQVTRHPVFRIRSSQIRVKEPSILVIKNF